MTKVRHFRIDTSLVYYIAGLSDDIKSGIEQAESVLKSGTAFTVLEKQVVLKSGKKYIRVNNGCYFICSLDKASVFPFSQMDKLKKTCAISQKGGVKDIAIFRLVLTEHPVDNIEKCGF